MTTYQRSAVHTAADIQAIADHAGSFFFSADTMRFFSSRILTGIVALDGAKTEPGNRFLFLTSERHGIGQPRHYAVRLATLTTQRDDRPGLHIATVGDYHATAGRARTAMRDYATVNATA